MNSTRAVFSANTALTTSKGPKTQWNKGLPRYTNRKNKRLMKYYRPIRYLKKTLKVRRKIESETKRAKRKKRRKGDDLLHQMVQNQVRGVGVKWIERQKRVLGRLCLWISIRSSKRRRSKRKLMRDIGLSWWWEVIKDREDRELQSHYILQMKERYKQKKLWWNNRSVNRQYAKKCKFYTLQHKEKEAKSDIL